RLLLLPERLCGRMPIAAASLDRTDPCPNMPRMGGRTKPNWGVFEGGPMHGERRLMHGLDESCLFKTYERSATPGMHAVHQYLLTDEYRRGEKNGGMKLSPARVARHVRALPDEPGSPTAPGE